MQGCLFPFAAQDAGPYAEYLHNLRMADYKWTVLADIRCRESVAARILAALGGVCSKKVKPILEQFIKEKPQWWSRIYPRIYSDTGQYNSPKDAAIDIWSALVMSPSTVNFDVEKLPHNDRLAMAAAVELLNKKVPTFFLAPQLVEALMQTKPPEPLDWVNISLPFESALFVFPKGTFTHKTEGEVGFLWYGRLEGKRRYQHPFYPLSSETPGSRLIFRTMLEGSMSALSQNYAAESTPFLEIADLCVEAARYEPSELEREINDDDKNVLQKSISLTIGAILAMLARPDLLSSGKPTGKKSKRGCEFWTPNVIGGSYKAATHGATFGKSGVQPRMHWRRGHFRSQPYGAGSSKRRTIWLEPVLVAATASE